MTDFCYDILASILLFLCPADEWPVPLPVPECQGLYDAILRHGRKQEVLPGNMGFTSTEGALYYVRSRVERAKSFPPLSDRAFWPEIPSDVYFSLREFNKGYAEHCRLQADLDPLNRSFWSESANEADRVWNLWASAKEVHWSSDPYWVRMALKDLKDKLGNSRYYRGELPPHVPVWRFRSLDSVR